MNGQRNRAQTGSGKHHGDIGGRVAAHFGEEFGLAGMSKTLLGKQGLGDGAGDQAARFSGNGEPGRLAERMQRQPRALGQGLAGPVFAVLPAEHRQRPVEQNCRFGRVGNPRHRYGKTAHFRRGRDHRFAAHDEEGRQLRRDPLGPGLGDQFRPYPRRIAQGNRHGRNGERSGHSRFNCNRSRRRGAGRADTSARAC